MACADNDRSLTVIPFMTYTGQAEDFDPDSATICHRAVLRIPGLPLIGFAVEIDPDDGRLLVIRAVDLETGESASAFPPAPPPLTFVGA